MEFAICSGVANFMQVRDTKMVAPAWSSNFNCHIIKSRIPSGPHIGQKWVQRGTKKGSVGDPAMGG